MFNRTARASPWKFIHQCNYLFRTQLRYVVGNGSKVRYWEDLLVGPAPPQTSYPRLFRLSTFHNAPISSFLIWDINSYSWNFHFFTDLNDREAVEVTSLLDHLAFFHPSD